MPRHHRPDRLAAVLETRRHLEGDEAGGVGGGGLADALGADVGVGDRDRDARGPHEGIVAQQVALVVEQARRHSVRIGPGGVR